MTIKTKGNYPFLPQTIMIEPTNACNLKCFMCDYQQQLTGVRNYLSLEDFKSVISQFPKIEALVFCGLGEPLLNKDIFEMVAYAATRTKYVNLITNGTLLTEDYFKRLLEAGLTRLQVSYHSDNSAVASQVSGVPLEFHELIKNNIINAIRLRDKLKSELTFVLNCVLNARNYGEIFNLINFCYIYGVDEICFVRMTTIFGKLDNISFTADEFQRLAQTIRKYLKKIGLKGGILGNLKECRQMWNFIMIHSDGNISPCNGIMPHENIGIGNIFNKHINEIWHSEKYAKLREMVKRNKLVNCKYCEVGK